MSKILFCLSNAVFHDNTYKIADLYDQIITELARFGNDVLVYIPNMFQQRCFCSENPLKVNIDEEKLRSDIADFNPDLVFSGNNAIYNKLLEVVNCNIAVWDADLPYWWNQKGYIKKNLDRYYFLCGSERNMKYPKMYFNCSDDRVFNIKNATSLVSTDAEKKTNISFIGSDFGPPPLFLLKLINRYSGTEDLKKFFDAVHEDPLLSSDEIIEKINPTDEFKLSLSATPSENYVSLFSRENRFLALTSVADLGLDLYSDRLWEDMVGILPSMISCQKKRIVLTAKENEEVYNSSKICLNVMHSQTRKGLPFRVPDIMATSGCLVSEYTPYIENCFKGANIPFFEHPTEAHDICKKLLAEENRRLDIVAACNEIIEKDWRWKYRFKDIEQITGVSLFPDKEGSCRILQPVYKKETKNLSLKYKIYYAIWKRIDKKLKKKGIV